VSLTDQLIGETLQERYRIEEFATEEMLGRVFIARDLEQDKLVHVKVLYPHLAGDAKKFARFAREFTASKMVQHPNTVEVLGWGQDDRNHWLIFEYLNAETLQEEIDRGPIEPTRAAQIGAQIAAAVGAAHQESIVHRNLSPNNILLLRNASKGAYVKVRDFGLSRLDDGPGGSDLTEVGSRLGNVQYMSPEYIDSEMVHPRSDVYALGIVLYQMLTGEVPYPGRAGVVLSAHVTQLMPMPSGAMPGLPKWCDEVVKQLTMKNPTDRPGAYGAVVAFEKAVGSATERPRLLPLNASGEFEAPSEASPVLIGAVVAGIGAVISGTVAVSIVVGLLCWVAISGLTPNSPEPVAAASVAEAPPVEADPPPPPTEDEPPQDASEDEREEAATPEPSESARKPAAEQPATGGVLKVRANRRALLQVDGVAVGYSPMDINLTLGEHHITAAIPGRAGSEQTETVVVMDGYLDGMTFQF